MRINVTDSTMVKPMAETPSGSLPLSNLDLLTPINYHTRTVYFYRRAGAGNFFDATVLKAALSRALVEFYPFAGRLKRDHKGRIEIDCNGEGMLFVEAECDAAMDELGDFTPTPELSLTPPVDYSGGLSSFPLSLLQLTRFKCGGVSLGVANDHHVVDGVSAQHFLRSWSDMARGLIAVVVPPILDRRRFLSARHPPRPEFRHVEYELPPTSKSFPQNPQTKTTTLKLTRDQLNALKAKCNAAGKGKQPNYTAFEVLSGHVWRCATAARRLPECQEIKLHIPCQGRRNLRPPLPPGYFGNVVFHATPIATCGELGSNPLTFSVHKIHDSITRMHDRYLRSGLDYLEQLSTLPYSEQSTISYPNLWMVSWVGLGVYDVDFGWGDPFYMGAGAAPIEGKGYLSPSPKSDGSLLLTITLLTQHMELFEKLFYHI